MRAHHYISLSGAGHVEGGLREGKRFGPPYMTSVQRGGGKYPKFVYIQIWIIDLQMLNHFFGHPTWRKSRGL